MGSMSTTECAVGESLSITAFITVEPAVKCATVPSTERSDVRQSLERQALRRCPASKIRPFSRGAAAHETTPHPDKQRADGCPQSFSNSLSLRHSHPCCSASIRFPLSIKYRVGTLWESRLKGVFRGSPSAVSGSLAWIAWLPSPMKLQTIRNPARRQERDFCFG